MLFILYRFVFSANVNLFSAAKLYSFTFEPFKIYFIQVWGAGSANSKGGYASGYLYTEKKTNAFVVVGGKGIQCADNTIEDGGFNGGGKCGGKSLVKYYSGGGATDVRVEKNDIYHRIIVAGGAGGTSTGGTGSSNCQSLYGGGETGGADTGTYDGKAGTATSGGSCPTGQTCSKGTFGYGGDITTALDKGNGGGGGWYGGATGANPGIGTAGDAGGGSGFVLTAENYKTAGPYNYAFRKDPKYALTSTTLLAGNQNFPSTSGGFETGHSGDGYAKITIVREVKQPRCTLNIHKYKKQSKNSLIFYVFMLS